MSSDLPHTALYLYLKYLHPESIYRERTAQCVVLIGQARVDLGYSFGWYGSAPQDYPKSMNLRKDHAEMTWGTNKEEFIKHLMPFYEKLELKLKTSAQLKLDELRPLIKIDSTVEELEDTVRLIMSKSKEYSSAEENIRDAVNQLLIEKQESVS